MDLLVEFDRPLGFEFVALADGLEVLLGRAVDLGQRRYVKPAIRARVLAEAVALVFDGHAEAAQTVALDVSSLEPGVYVLRAVAGRTPTHVALVVAR